jgi:hypothetical protein
MSPGAGAPSLLGDATKASGFGRRHMSAQFIDHPSEAVR